MTGLATHLLLELYGVSPRILDDVTALENVLSSTAEASGCTVLGLVSHKFQTQGAYVVVLVAESHLSIHTWPEHSYASADIFTCGAALPQKGIDPIVRALKPEHHEVTEIARGTNKQRLRGVG